MTETANPADYSLSGLEEGRPQLSENQPNISTSKDIASADEFLLAEDVDTQEETEDESDEVNPDLKGRKFRLKVFTSRRKLLSSSH